jgi:CRP-like cAMP-binding protein
MSIYAFQLLKGLGLSEQRVIRLLPILKIRTYKANQVICSKGQRLSPWTHVISGMVSAGVPGDGGEFTPVNIYGAGTWFGETAIFNRQASSLECVSLTPSRAMTMPLAHVLDAFDHEPEFARHMARLMSWRNQQQAEMLTLMRIGSPQLRVVLGLALFAEALNSSSSHLPTSPLEDMVAIPLTQSMLASHCGVSRGVFSACLQQLSAAGWVQLNYGAVNLVSLKTWSEFSSSQRNNSTALVKSTMPELLLLMHEASAN